MVLSILMVTLSSRKEMFDKVHQHILKQINDNHLENEVEIVVFEDEKQYPVGMKRNALIKEAKGNFTCFVDDDDWVSDDYVMTLYTAIALNPEIDCVGMKGLLVSGDLGDKEFIHSIKFDSYWEDATYYYRPPNHLNPIKRSITSKFNFPLMNRGEDTDWSLNICRTGVLQKEVFVDKVLYFYRFEYATSETQRRRSQG